MFNFQKNKMIKALNNVSLPSSGIFPGAARHGLPRKYVSPNGQYRAYVTPVYNPQSSKDESEIIIKSDKGKILFQKGYFSSEDEDGLFVVEAEWSADSRFFVYSMVNPCAHKPWNFPTFFISTDRVTRKGDRKYFAWSLSDTIDHQPWHFPSFSIPDYQLQARSLDECIGTVVYPKFALYEPDIIRIMAISRTIKDQYYFKVSLSDMLKN